MTIVKPIQGKFYFNDAEKMSFSGNNTIVYGKITIHGERHFNFRYHKSRILCRWKANQKSDYSASTLYLATAHPIQ